MNIDLNESPLEELQFTSLDLETTGLNPGSAEIVEIAAVKFAKGKTISTFNELVKPRKSLNPEAIKVNGITEDMLVGARDLDSVLPDFLKFIDSTVLVIQNSTFDLGFLIYEARNRRLPFPTLPVFCTVQMTRKYFPELKKYNLVALRETFRIDKKMTRNESSSKIHEALDDSYATMHVFLKLLEKTDGWKKRGREINFHEKGLMSTKDFDPSLL